MHTVTITNHVTLNQCVTPEEGQAINNIIRSHIAEGDIVRLDFTGIQLVTTAFLNVAIGTLYKDMTSEQLKGKLSFSNITDGIAIRIKRVTDNAKAFYKNPELFQQNVEQVLYGEN